MKYKIWSMMIGVSLCLMLLTSCGDGESPEKTTIIESAVSVSDGNLKPESVVISVGKTKVTYGEYLAYSHFMKNPYEGVVDQSVWNYNQVEASGKTIGQEAIESVLRLIIQVKVICKEAAAQKVSLATDEKEQASHSAKVVCDSLSEDVKTKGVLNFKMVENIFTENKLAKKMYNIEIGKVNANLAPAQLKCARVQLLFVGANDKNRAVVKKKMDEIYQNVINRKTNFYVAAKQNSEAEEIEALVGRSDSRSKLANTVAGMKRGQISNIISEKDGFYIARCIVPDSSKMEAEYRNQVIMERQIQAFQNAYKEWSQKFEVKVSKALLAEQK